MFPYSFLFSGSFEQFYRCLKLRLNYLQQKPLYNYLPAQQSRDRESCFHLLSLEYLLSEYLFVLFVAHKVTTRSYNCTLRFLNITLQTQRWCHRAPPLRRSFPLAVTVARLWGQMQLPLWVKGLWDKQQFKGSQVQIYGPADPPLSVKPTHGAVKETIETQLSASGDAAELRQIQSL